MEVHESMYELIEEVKYGIRRGIDCRCCVGVK
jgi:hypothetical protein